MNVKDFLKRNQDSIDCISRKKWENNILVEEEYMLYIKDKYKNKKSFYIKTKANYERCNQYLMKQIKLYKNSNDGYKLTVYDNMFYPYPEGYFINDFSEEKSSIEIVNKNSFFE